MSESVNMPETAARAVVVTGGAAGIGHAVALRLAEGGYRLAILDRDAGGAAGAALLAEEHGSPRAIGVACDVSSEESVRTAVALAAAEFGDLYGAVTSAGIDLGGMVHELSLERWRQVLDVNLTGTFLTAKHMLHHLMERRLAGVIVCVSSPWAYLSTPGGASAYCASKGGVCALARSMALDYASHGIRVNTILPGATETALMWANVPMQDRERMRQKVEASLPMRRLARPREIAEGVSWLLSPQASYMTGSELILDGGLMSKGCIDA